MEVDTVELGYGPLYDRLLHMTDNILGPSPMHIKYVSYVYDGFCILHMTYQFSWSHWVRHIQVHLYTLYVTKNLVSDIYV